MHPGSVGELDALYHRSACAAVLVTIACAASSELSSDSTTHARLRILRRIARPRSERAGAEEAARLQLRASELRTEIARLRERGNASSPDPVGEFYAWATRGLLSVRDVAFGFPLFFALMIEIVTAFGPITVVRFAEVSAGSTGTSNTGGTWRAPTSHVAPRPVAGLVTDRLDDRVAEWMSARAMPRSDGGATSLSNLHRDFDAWCGAQQLPSCEVSAFAQAFDRLREMPELNGKIRKFGSRYYGIAVRGGAHVGS